MPIKSDNVKGNPYHDESTGEFTSAENTSSKNEESLIKEIKLKSGVNIEDIKADVARRLEDKKNKIPSSIEEAEEIGNLILGTDAHIVGYDKRTSVEVAHQFNNALKDMVNAFPRLFKNDLLIAYGTEGKGTQTFEKRKQLWDEVVNSEPFASYLKSMGFYGILDSDVYASLNNNVLFNLKPLPQEVGGLTAIAKKGNAFVYSSIKLNLEHSKSLEKQNNYVDSGVNMGAFLPVLDENKKGYSIAAHELGHHIDFVMQNMVFEAKENSERRRLIKTGNQLGFVEFLSSGKTKSISGYAVTHGDEQIAEAFADYFANGENATNHNKNIVNFYKKVYDEKFK